MITRKRKYTSVTPLDVSIRLVDRGQTVILNVNTSSFGVVDAARAVLSSISNTRLYMGLIQDLVWRKLVEQVDYAFMNVTYGTPYTNPDFVVSMVPTIRPVNERGLDLKVPGIMLEARRPDSGVFSEGENFRGHVHLELIHGNVVVVSASGWLGSKDLLADLQRDGVLIGVR